MTMRIRTKIECFVDSDTYHHSKIIRICQQYILSLPFYPTMAKILDWGTDPDELVSCLRRSD